MKANTVQALTNRSVRLAVTTTAAGDTSARNAYFRLEAVLTGDVRRRGAGGPIIAARLYIAGQTEAIWAPVEAIQEPGDAPALLNFDAIDSGRE